MSKLRRDLATVNLRGWPRLEPERCGAIRFWRCFRAYDFSPRKLLQDGVFKRLCRAQANHRLGLDLDSLAGLRIAAHASLAARFGRAGQIGNHEFSGATLALFHRELEELF